MHASSLSAENCLRDYFRGKDENRPRYIERAFAPNATLDMALRTEAIAFPARTQGNAAIADVLARDFGRRYDNVHTYAMARPGRDAVLSDYCCDWLVVMTEKDSGQVRVGCGGYDWRFEAEPPHRVCALTITIETMLTLPASSRDIVYAWVDDLPYPWCDPVTAVHNAPAIEALRPALDYLRP